jgi:hypothetical protein
MMQEYSRFNGDDRLPLSFHQLDEKRVQKLDLGTGLKLTEKWA